MKIKIKDFLQDEIIEEVVEVKKNKNTLKYIFCGDKQEIKILEDRIILLKEGQSEYTFEFRLNKLTKSIIKVDQMLMDIYLLTTKLDKSENKILIEYILFNDKNLKNLVSKMRLEIGDIDGK